MAEIKKFDEFIIEETDEGYIITLTALGGEALKVSLTPEDIGDVLEALHEVLGDDDDDLDEEDDEIERPA